MLNNKLETVRTDELTWYLDHHLMEFYKVVAFVADDITTLAL